MRELLASVKARPEEIAIAAASPVDFDDHVLALSRDANIPVHFVHGTKAVAGRDGQTAAALAEVLVKGVSQERVRRLLALLGPNPPPLRELPANWTRILPPDAPLTTVERWEQVFRQTSAEDWPDGVDCSRVVLDFLRLLAEGPGAAEKVGQTLLPGVARALWRRALDDGPAQALPVTLIGLRSDDGLEPARIAPCRTIVAAAPAYLEAHGTPTTVAELTRHNCLGYTLSRVTGANNWSFGANGGITVQVAGNLRANNGDALRAAAIAGQGIIYQPTFVVADDVLAGTLVPLPLDQPTIEFGGIYAVYLPERNPAAKVRAFIDFLVERFSPVPSWDRMLLR